MSKAIPQITDSEWVVMKALWEKSPLLSRDIIKSVSERSTWNNKTIETLLRRLVDKEAVGYNLINSKVREYYPLVSQEECEKVESESFLKKVYNGSVSMLIAGLLKHQKVSKEELERLKELVDFDKEE